MSASPSKYPNIVSFDSKELPDIKNWQPGKKYRVTMDIEMTGYSVGGYDQNDTAHRANFKITSVKPQYGGQGKANAKPPKGATMTALQRKAAQS